MHGLPAGAPSRRGAALGESERTQVRRRDPGTRIEEIDAFVKHMFDSGDPPSRVSQLCRWARYRSGEAETPLVRASWRAALWRAAVLQADAEAAAQARETAAALLRKEIDRGRNVVCCVAEDREALAAIEACGQGPDTTDARP